MKKVYSMFFAAAVSGAVLTSCPLQGPKTAKNWALKPHWGVFEPFFHGSAYTLSVPWQNPSACYIGRGPTKSLLEFPMPRWSTALSRARKQPKIGP